MTPARLPLKQRRTHMRKSLKRWFKTAYAMQRYLPTLAAHVYVEHRKAVFRLDNRGDIDFWLAG